MIVDYRNLDKKSGIYCLINHIDGKIYVGQSVNLKKRKHEHFNMPRNNKHFNRYLQNAFNKYPNAFEFRVIELCDDKVLDEREIFFIKQLHAKEKGYNLCDGGGTSKGRTCSLETRKKNIQSKKRNDER